MLSKKFLEKVPLFLQPLLSSIWSQNTMESLFPSSSNETYYLVAEVNKSKPNNDQVQENVETPAYPPEALLSKSSHRVLSAKQKNRSALVTEVPEEEIQGNPIGMLQELCMMRRWMPPEYATEQEEGLPHERLFTIRCSVGNFKEYGIGRSKKLAKRQSAHKMVQKILMIPIEDENSLRNLEDDDEIADRFASQKGHKDTGVNGVSRKVSLFHKNLKCLSGNTLQELKGMNSEELHNIDVIKQLGDIALENKLDVTYVNIEEKSKSYKFQSLVQLSTVPVAVCFGTGDSVEDAKREAAVEALKYIKLLSSE